jgi:hypothetical protein
VQPIRAIADLPFRERPARELLNLTVHRAAPDPDYTGFGHCRADVSLEAKDGAVIHVREALVLALHCTDAALALGSSDLELEFFVDEVAAGYSVTTPLPAFLAVWLPRLCRPGGEQAVVLALCNPGRAVVRRPPGLDAATPLFYGLGDVETWFDAGIILTADGWATAE